MQLAALAFPPEPFALPRVPDPPPMKQDEAVPVRCRAVRTVQPLDSSNRGPQERVIARRILGATVRPVRKQSEAKIAIWSREVMNLQAFNLLFEFGGRRQKRG